MTMYLHKIFVKGSFQFPIDMLRYDRCHPASETDSGKILRIFEPGGSDDNEQIVLHHYDSYRHWTPTNERWASFGWKVTGHEVVKCG